MDARTQRFGAGLTEPAVRRLQAILRRQDGPEVGLPEAWSRAIELLSLVELLLESGEMPPGSGSAGVRAPSLLTNSGS